MGLDAKLVFRKALKSFAIYAEVIEKAGRS
jgi:hypothetical protein